MLLQEHIERMIEEREKQKNSAMISENDNN